jgi:hypothetical protein
VWTVSLKNATTQKEVFVGDFSHHVGGDELAGTLWPGLERPFLEDLAPLADELIE